MNLRDEIARRVWLQKSDGDNYWSQMVAPTMTPDYESEQIADAVLDLLREYDVELPS